MKVYAIKFHPNIKDKVFTSKEKRDEFVDNNEEYQKYIKSGVTSFSLYSTEID